MRSLPIIALSAAILTSCSPVAPPTCETRPDGVRLFIDRKAGDYRDLVQALRRDPNQMVAAAAGQIGVEPSGPSICKDGRTFTKAVGITYPPRNARQVGATLDLYFGEDGKVAVAEFYVIPLAP